MKIEARVETASVKRVQRSLRYLAKHSGKDLMKANRKAGVWLFRWVHDNFQTEGGKVGRWKPFKYGGRMIGKGNTRRFDANAKLLQDTRRLISSFDTKVTKKTVTIGSDLPYAKYHELGVKGRGLPARRMLPRHTDTDVQKKLLQIYDHHIETAIKRA